MYKVIFPAVVYALLVAVHFVFMYRSIDKVYRTRNAYQNNMDEFDRVFISVATSLIFIVTVWFTVPYILMGLKDCEKSKRIGYVQGEDGK